MQNVDELAELETTARTLVAQNLRSKAVLLERLRPMIDRANSLGHLHTKIHEVLTSAGVDMTFNVYMTTLKRVRKRAGIASTGSTKPVGFGSGEPNLSGSQEPKGEKLPPEPISDGSAFGVRDALTAAKKTYETDYSRIARTQRKK